MPAFPGAVRRVRSGRARTRGEERCEAQRRGAEQNAARRARHGGRRTGVVLLRRAAPRSATKRRVVSRPYAVRRNEGQVRPCAVPPCAVRPCAGPPCVALPSAARPELPCVEPVELPCAEPLLPARRLDVPAAPWLA